MKYGFTALLCACCLLAGCSADDGRGIIVRHQSSLVDRQDRICILGDPGTGRRTQFAVARAAQEAGCTQIRIVGDIIYPAGIQNERDPLLESRFFRPFRDLLRQAEFYLVQGNHDYIRDDEQTAWKKIAKDNPNINYPYPYYAETWQDICFFSLDTTIYEKLYYLFRRAPQTSWIRGALDRASNGGGCRFSVVFAHHPYRASGQHGKAQLLLESFLEREIIGKVDLYIAGHDHILSDEGSIDGTRLLVSGTAGKQTRNIQRRPGNQFVSRESGFIMLQFRRNDNGQIVADYDIRTVEVRAARPLSFSRWKGSVDGYGIRQQAMQPGYKRVDRIALDPGLVALDTHADL